MKPLTDRQQQCLDIIRNSIADRGFPPTLREIGVSMNIRSTNGVNDHLRALERKGHLTREDLKSRGIRPTGGVDHGPARPLTADMRTVLVQLRAHAAEQQQMLLSTYETYGETITRIDQALTSDTIVRSQAGRDVSIFDIALEETGS